MRTTVTTLLREFPKIRRAALNGERVIIETREGNLVLEAERPKENRILGSWKGKIRTPRGVDLTQPTTEEREWLK
jgi:hypothetical protein